MKTIIEYINENAHKKYCIHYIDKNGHNNDLLTNSLKDIPSDVLYYAVCDNTKWNFSEPEALIEWGGKGGYWANSYEHSIDPKNAPKWSVPFKGQQLEKIKKCKKW